MAKMRRNLSLPGMLSDIRREFSRISDEKSRRSGIKLSDCLMSGLAVFSLKYPSLLQFDRERRGSVTGHNLRSLYRIEQAPSDTYMRERLDDVEPDHIDRAYRKVLSRVQRGGELEKFGFMDGYYLVSVDGTGFFSSDKVHCEHCCEQHHRDGKVTYYHQMLGAALVHPEHSHVLPFAPEPIRKQDGRKKNDCEHNAAMRLLSKLRREHPRLKAIVVEDSLSSNGPHIRFIKELGFKFILVAKPSNHKFLFDWVDAGGYKTHEHKDKDKGAHRYRYMNNVPLNDANFDLKVNFLEYWYTNLKGKTVHFSWVTDIPLCKSNVYWIMRGGRARWRIENETFNTLKNQGYHFEHNFGHGHKHLSTVMAKLMTLAFMVDQVQGLCCKLFKQALTKAERKTYLWEHIRSFFFTFCILSWEDLYRALINKPLMQLVPDTS